MSVTITISDTGMDMPESHCDGCDMRFGLIWPRNPVYDRPDYCPFCGEEIDEVIDERFEPTEEMIDEPATAREGRQGDD